jgi:subtilase family serine protease
MFADVEARGISFTSPPTAGRRTTAVARLANDGRAPSGPFNVTWRLDGRVVDFGREPSLDPGRTRLVRLPWTPSRGRHTLRFEADPDDRVQESDEGNNTASITVLVR